MNKGVFFVAGVVTGVYLEQTYKMPVIRNLIEYLQKLEERNRRN
jgi:hypothetical protein